MKNIISATNKQNVSTYRTFLSLLLILFLNPLLSQDNRTYIGIDFYPTSTNQLTSTISKPNLLRFSYNFGLNVRQELAERKLYLETGIKTINRGYGYSVDVFNFLGRQIGSYKYEKHNNYISIPLLVGVKVNSFYFELGPSIDYLYSNQIFEKSKWMTNTELDRKINFSGNASIGAIIQPKNSRKLLFNIGAYANITLFEQYLNAGLKVGVKYHIKKKVKRFNKN
jgi:hypothetical protein